MSLSSLNSIGQSVSELRVRKRKCGRTDGRINLINYDAHLQLLSNVPTNYQLTTLYSFRDIAWTKF